MRYLLLLLGLVGLILGGWVVCYGNAHAYSNGVLMVVVGAIFFAAGGAAIDLVDALIRRRV